MTISNFNTIYYPKSTVDNINTVTTNYGSDQVYNINIPGSASNITITVSGGAGGNGGGGRTGSFSLPANTARTLTLSPGNAGGATTGGNTQIGNGDGGDGSAGGGGAASIVFDSVAGSDIIIGAGGGGAGTVGQPYQASTSTLTRDNGNPGGAGGGGGGGSGGSAASGFGGGSRYRSDYVTAAGGDAVGSGSGFIQVQYQIITPTIGTFYASPNPQDSSSPIGIPSSTVRLYWSTTDAIQIYVKAGTAMVAPNLAASGTYDVNTNLQSVAGSTSPATVTYTLYACTSTGFCSTQDITVSVFDDNTPNAFAPPTQTTTGVSLTSLEPNVLYIAQVGPISGIDMATACTVNTIASPGVDLSLNGGTWSNTVYIINGGVLLVRFYSLPFNTDPSGLTNSKSIEFSVGSTPGSFFATTRAPDVNETFDIGDSNANYPYPDIDSLSNNPLQYIETIAENVNDIEVPVEIKTSDPNIQVKINNGTWQNVRQI